MRFSWTGVKKLATVSCKEIHGVKGGKNNSIISNRGSLVELEGATQSQTF